MSKETQLRPGPTSEAMTSGLSIWLPTRDAKRLTVLAKDAGVSLADTISRLIGEAFRGRYNGS